MPLPPLTAKEGNESVAHLHFHFAPPLLRSSRIRKFLVGFEMFAESQVSAFMHPVDGTIDKKVDSKWLLSATSLLNKQRRLYVLYQMYITWRGSTL
jgi:hypothetical protein